MVRLPLSLLVSLLVLAAPARADEAAQPLPPQAWLRLRSGLAFHQGLAGLEGPPLAYGGWSADSTGLEAAFYGLPELGGWVRLERTALAPSAAPGGERLTPQLLGRVQAGLLARVPVEAVWLEAGLGLHLAQLSAVRRADGSVPAPGLQRGLVLLLRGEVPLPYALQLRVQGSLPLSLWAVDGQGAPVDVAGEEVGAALGRQLGTVGPLAWGLWLDYRFARERLGGLTGRTQREARSQVALALELSWAPPAEPDDF